MMEKQLVFENHMKPYYPFFDGKGEVFFYNLEEKMAFGMENLKFKQGDEIFSPTLMTFGMSHEDKFSMKYAFYYWGNQNAFDELFDEHNNWYQEQMAVLQSKYLNFKSTRYKESGVFFKKNGMISHDDINDPDFLQYLIDHQTQSLQFKITAINVESLGIHLLERLVIIFNDSFFTDSLNLKMFAEYSLYKEAQFDTMLRDLEIGQKSQIVKTVDVASKGKETFEGLFATEQQKEMVWSAMIALKIIGENGTCILKPREKSKLLAFANALNSKELIPSRSIKEYSRIFCEKLNIPNTTLKADSHVYRDFTKEVLSYLNR